MYAVVLRLREIEEIIIRLHNNYQNNMIVNGLHVNYRDSDRQGLFNFYYLSRLVSSLNSHIKASRFSKYDAGIKLKVKNIHHDLEKISFEENVLINYFKVHDLVIKLTKLFEHNEELNNEILNIVKKLKTFHDNKNLKLKLTTDKVKEKAFNLINNTFYFYHDLFQSEDDLLFINSFMIILETRCPGFMVYFHRNINKNSNFSLEGFFKASITKNKNGMSLDINKFIKNILQYANLQSCNTDTAENKSIKIFLEYKEANDVADEFVKFTRRAKSHILEQMVQDLDCPLKELNEFYSYWIHRNGLSDKNDYWLRAIIRIDKYKHLSSEDKRIKESLMAVLFNCNLAMDELDICHEKISKYDYALKHLKGIIKKHDEINKNLQNNEEYQC